MKVTRGQIVQRGLTHRCPNCGEATLFKPGVFYRLNPACARCGNRFDLDEGAFLGAFALNYGVTAFGVVVPMIAITYSLDLDIVTIAVLAAAASLVVPILLYRPSRSWWIMCDALFAPEQLPANQPGPTTDA